MASAHHLIASSRVEGVPVFDRQGDKLGKIDDIMIDKASGGAVYALMSFDGFLGMGERFYPIPWSLLSYDTEKDGYLVPLTRADIEKGRSVDDREIADEIQWREALHDYYRAAPYWLSPRAML